MRQLTAARAVPALRAALIALLLVAALPWPVAGAEASPEPSVEPTPTVEPSPTVEPQPSPSPEPTPVPSPSPDLQIQDVVLYRAGAVVRQYTGYWCVPASAQTMINLVNGSAVRTLSFQKFLAVRIRLNNRYRYRTRGNDVGGWKWALNRRIPGAAYAVRTYPTRSAAVGAMIDAIDRTGHPVGIVVDAGTHAWVVLGYRAAVTSGETPVRTIQGLYVYGPLGSSRDPYPYRYLSLASFNRRYTRYHERTRRVVWEGKYVIVSE